MESARVYETRCEGSIPSIPIAVNGLRTIGETGAWCSGHHGGLSIRRGGFDSLRSYDV